MSLSLGIVGLPNVGKSTLFNALTRNNVVAANYPFATIEPNEGVVSLPDPRLDKLAELHKEGATICMVTHDPRFARYAERSIHLFDGRVVEEEQGVQREVDQRRLADLLDTNNSVEGRSCSSLIAFVRWAIASVKAKREIAC